MRDAAAILMDDLLTNIDLIYNCAIVPNASINQEVPQPTLHIRLCILKQMPRTHIRNEQIHFFWAEIRKREV